MLNHRLMMLLALALAISPQQETVCERIGGTTYCRSNAPARIIPQPGTPPQDPQIDQSVDAAKNRRAAAYGQVAQLIADKRCDDAKRVAAFYGQKDLIEDTARVCR